MQLQFQVTFFNDVYAKSLRLETMTVETLGDLIRGTVSPSKDAQPQLKLATFGTDPLQPSGCLRHDKNLVAVNGIELDYDREEMPLSEACDRLDARGLAYVGHTTARHTAATPRWHLYMPFSKELSPGERLRMVHRVNGVLGGELNPESGVLSIGFYYAGQIVGQPPAEVLVGDHEECIDEADDLDAIALPLKPARKPAQGGQGGNLDLDDLDEAELRELIETGQVYYGAARRLVTIYETQGVTEADAISNLEAAFDAVPAAKRDAKWAKRRGSIKGWVRRGYARAAKRKGKPFSALVDHFEHSLLWKGALRFNRFASRVEVCDPFPPQPGQMPPASGGMYREYKDPADTLEAMISVQGDGFPRAGKGQVFDALFLAATRHAVHPVQTYFNSLEWDGKKRLHTLFTDYMPAYLPDDDAKAERVLIYLENIGVCFMVGAVARAFRPGCKNDYLPLLISPQGYNKSKALCSLVPDPTWFSDDIPTSISDKDAKQALDGKLIIELAELPQLRREAEHVKAFFSRSTDRYRPPYGRVPLDWPRSCVFIGTGNALEFVDVTGNRRFWPLVLIAPIDDEAIARDRDQLWAEATHEYRQGRKWWLSPEVEKIAAEIQDEFVESDVRDEPIQAWIDLVFARKGLIGKPIRFTVREVLEGALGFAIDAKDETRPLASNADEKRVIRRLRRLGYRPDPVRSRADGQRRYWVPVRS